VTGKPEEVHDREAADRLEREPTAPDRPPDGRQSAPPSAAAVLALQQAAGNAAVQRLVRGGPSTDPKFGALKRDVAGKQRRLAAHRPPRTEAAAAQGAAKPPADDKLAQGKVAQAGEMDAAKPGGFDKAAFIKAVNDAIASQAPKNLDEADKFADSGKADQVKGQVQGRVVEGKKVSTGQIESTTRAAPDTSKAVAKPVTPLSPDQPPPAPGGPDPAQAVPDKAPPETTDFSAGPRQVNSQMDQAQVSEEQLAKSNEPEFTDALKAKKDGEKHAATAPPQLRASENQTLTAGKQQAAAAGTTAMASMALHRRTAGAQVHAGKQSTQSGDEARRAAATAKLQGVFDATKTDVEGILTGLDKKVDEQFTSLEGEARLVFTAEHKAKMDAYKDRRYSGWTGKLRWVKDKFTGLPEEANQIFVQARAGYTARMQQVISTIADTIAAELTRAKQRIAKGKTDLAAEVNKLPADLKAMGQEAAAGFTSKFDELTDQVNSKGTDLVQTLASKYTEALKSVDAEIEAEKEKNKGLIAKAMDAVKGVIDTILKLKDLLLGILAKAASAVMAIIKDPIGFLGNLVHAVGAGLRDFIANIGEHLKKGLVSWLLGAAAQAGLQIPAKFDLKGILSLIGGLLGLTWSAIRGRVVSRGIPDQAVTAAEKAVPEAEALQKEGLPGLWQRIQTRIGSLKDMIMGKLAAFLIPTVLIAGITWLVSLLTPASAFVKACKAIIDIVTFIVERGAQIAMFVNAVLDAVIAIAGGGAGGVPGLIVNALAASIPVLIGFLAALLGVGGIADKVKKVFQAVAKPVMKVVDWVVDKIVKLAKKFWNKLKNKFGKGDGKDRSPERKDRDLKAGLAAADKVAAKGTPVTEIPGMLPAIRSKYQMQSLDMVIDQSDEQQATVHFVGAVNPRGDSQKRKVPNKPVKVEVGEKVQLRDGNSWALGEVTGVTETHFDFIGHGRGGEVKATLSLANVGTSWRKWKPEMSYKTGEAFEAIRNLSVWSNFPDARQVLSYRAHGSFNVPPGKNWHHIHENSAGGAHSVQNLALATAGQNQDFNVWFSRPQRNTGGVSVREFLRGAPADVHRMWGLDCITKHGYSVASQDQGRGPYQEIV
jgi:hypothetical protein